MKKLFIHEIQVTVDNCRRSCRFSSILLLGTVLMLAGCVTVKPQQQRLVSKPNMQFSGSVIFNYQDRSLTQIESGSASFIGGQSGNCGSCVAGGGQ